MIGTPESAPGPTFLLFIVGSLGWGYQQQVSVTRELVRHEERPDLSIEVVSRIVVARSWRGEWGGGTGRDGPKMQI